MFQRSPSTLMCSLTTEIRCLYVGDTCYENTRLRSTEGSGEIKLEEKSAPSKRLFYGPAWFHDIRRNFSFHVHLRHRETLQFGEQKDPPCSGERKLIISFRQAVNKYGRTSYDLSFHLSTIIDNASRRRMDFDSSCFYFPVFTLISLCSSLAWTVLNFDLMYTQYLHRA